jgi:toxin-antitoxin system PIN domain toxin
VSSSLDVNLLLYASDQSSPFNPRAVEFLEERAASRDALYISWPTIMGYLRVSTHPGVFTRPLDAREAAANMAALLQLPHVRAIAEEDGFWQVYQEVVSSWPARGNQVPDAHLAAILKQHGVRTLYTHDRDFRRFEFLRVLDPLA